ncbi:MAG: PD-(D/E)XK nuclease family protein, partial [Desulfosalsimonas sp.]
RIDSLEQEKLLPVFDWAGLGLRRVGVVVHRWLRVICEQGLENWGRERIRNSAALLRRDLLRTGMGDSDVESLFYKAEGALINAVSDDTGRWILSLRENGACEYAVSGLLDGKVVNAVIDRTFEDENGTRWVIDYKTGTHSGGGLSDFLDREQHRYSLQMERYGLLMKNFSGAAVRLGLYFPMIPAWRQWGLSEE